MDKRSATDAGFAQPAAKRQMLYTISVSPERPTAAELAVQRRAHGRTVCGTSENALDLDEMNERDAVVIEVEQIYPVEKRMGRLCCLVSGTLEDLDDAIRQNWARYDQRAVFCRVGESVGVLFDRHLEKGRFTGGTMPLERPLGSLMEGELLFYVVARSGERAFQLSVVEEVHDSSLRQRKAVKLVASAGPDNGATSRVGPASGAADDDDDEGDDGEGSAELDDMAECLLEGVVRHNAYLKLGRPPAKGNPNITKAFPFYVEVGNESGAFGGKSAYTGEGRVRDVGMGLYHAEIYTQSFAGDGDADVDPDDLRSYGEKVLALFPRTCLFLSSAKNWIYCHDVSFEVVSGSNRRMRQPLRSIHAAFAALESKLTEKGKWKG